MTTKPFLLVSILFMLMACGKKTLIKGTVYSMHGIPVPNVYVGWHEYRESSNPEKSVYYASMTNEKGEYNLCFQGNEEFIYSVFCQCDSGYQNNESVTTGKANTIDLHLK